MSSNDPEFWLRELARSGLSVSDQQELLTSLARAVADREKFFPSEPSPYLSRVRQLLLATFLPQFGPFCVTVNPDAEQEVLSRSQCWRLLHLEFTLLDARRRPAARVHDVITEVIGLLLASEFPLHIPPRWLVELFSDLSRVTTLRMESNGWTLRPQVALDWESQAYWDAVMRNLENDKRRSLRQLAVFTCGDTEAMVDAAQQSLLPPDGDAVVPPFPASFPWAHRPRFFLAPHRMDTPKRERTEGDSSLDSESGHREPKRRASGIERVAPAPPELSVSMPDANPGSLAIVPRTAPPIVSPYGTAPMHERFHYCLKSITLNPLRHYPSATSLYGGVMPDGALLNLPVFEAPFPPGELAKTFTRGENDPVVSVLNAVGAQRVSADALEFLTWNEQSSRPQPFYPFSDASDLFHVYSLPPRRVAPGRELHEWSFGVRLGEKASGAWSNLVTDKEQPRPPPALRKIDWRELLQILRASQQLGLPSSSNTDSKLGWAVYSYMSPEVLLNVCEGHKYLLLRIEGYCSKGHESSSKELAQKAKVGLCPCCARATHVLVPPVYPVGKPDRKKRNAISLWQQFGPFATRNYSAAMYMNTNGTLPDTWDWVATKHLLALPSPLNREDRTDSPERSPFVQSGLQMVGPPLPSAPVEPPSVKKIAKPPPPVHKGGATLCPGPAKSSSSFKGSPSRGSSWEGDWNPSGHKSRDWSKHQWYH